MTAPELRPYQREVIEQFHGAVAAGKRRVILVAPTGAGKTVIGADIIRTIARASRSRCSCWRIGARSSRRPPTSCMRDGIYRTASFMAGLQPRPLELVQVAIDPNPVGAQPAHREDGPAARRPAGDR